MDRQKDSQVRSQVGGRVLTNARVARVKYTRTGERRTVKADRKEAQAPPWKGRQRSTGDSRKITRKRQELPCSRTAADSGLVTGCRAHLASGTDGAPLSDVEDTLEESS